MNTFSLRSGRIRYMDASGELLGQSPAGSAMAAEHSM